MRTSPRISPTYTQYYGIDELLNELYADPDTLEEVSGSEMDTTTEEEFPWLRSGSTAYGRRRVA